MHFHSHYVLVFDTAIVIEGWTFSLGEACVIHRRSIGESSTGNLYRLLIRTKVLAR